MDSAEEGKDLINENGVDYDYDYEHDYDYEFLPGVSMLNSGLSPFHPSAR